MQPFLSPTRGVGVKTEDEQIYRKHKDDLIGYATALVGPDQAEDVLSAVVVRVLARRPLSELREPRPYLFRAVLNEARGTLRRRQVVGITEPASDAPDLEVLDAVMRLPVQQRAAVYLVYWVGLPVAETAKLMRLRPGTVKRYLHLARKSLKGALA